MELTTYLLLTIVSSIIAIHVTIPTAAFESRYDGSQDHQTKPICFRIRVGRVCLNRTQQIPIADADIDDSDDSKELDILESYQLDSGVQCKKACPPGFSLVGRCSCVRKDDE